MMRIKESFPCTPVSYFTWIEFELNVQRSSISVLSVRRRSGKRPIPLVFLTHRLTGSSRQTRWNESKPLDSISCGSEWVCSGWIRSVRVDFVGGLSFGWPGPRNSNTVEMERRMMLMMMTAMTRERDCDWNSFPPSHQLVRWLWSVCWPMILCSSAIRRVELSIRFQSFPLLRFEHCCHATQPDVDQSPSSGSYLWGTSLSCELADGTVMKVPYLQNNKIEG